MNTGNNPMYGVSLAGLLMLFSAALAAAYINHERRGATLAPGKH